MVNNIKLLDKVHLQKYIYILDLFISKQINATIFENLFLEIRRDDTYWLLGSFNQEIEKELNQLFFDVDEYMPENLYEIEDMFNINETELYKRSGKILERMKTLMF